MKTRTPRDQVLDAMRTLAVFFMAASHTTRLIQKDVRPFWSPFVMLVEPMVQSLFLALAGASIYCSWQATTPRHSGQRAPWLRAKWRRAAELYGLSFILFFVEFGPQWPHLLVSSGILLVIGAALGIYSTLQVLPRPNLWVALTTLAGLGLFAWLDLNEKQVLVLNHGNGPLLPTALFAGYGLLAYAAYQALAERVHRKNAIHIAVFAVLLASALALPIEQMFSEPLGRSTSRASFQVLGDGFSTTFAMWTGAALKTREPGWFNARLYSMPATAVLLALTYAGLAFARPLANRFGRRLFTIGRFSLGAYVFHLILVALPVLATGTRRPLDAAWKGWVYLGFVLLGCHGYATVRQWQTDRERARRRAAASG